MAVSSGRASPTPVLAPRLQQRMDELQFVHQVRMAQTKWEQERATIMRQWEETQANWAAERSVLQSQIQEQTALSEDERLCFVQELNQVSTQVWCLWGYLASFLSPSMSYSLFGLGASLNILPS
jgi:hypothetical protein